MGKKIILLILMLLLFQVSCTSNSSIKIISNSDSVQQGDYLDFKLSFDNISGDKLQTEWNIEDKNYFGNEIKHVFNHPGNVLVTVKSVSKNKVYYDSYTINVNQTFFKINPIKNKIYEGDTINLSVNYSQNISYDIIWNIDGQSIAGNQIKFTFKNPGMKTITAIAKIGNDVITSDSISFEVTNLITESSSGMIVNLDEFKSVMGEKYYVSTQNAAIPYPTPNTFSRKIVFYTRPYESWSNEMFVEGSLTVTISIDVFKTIEAAESQLKYLEQIQADEKKVSYLGIGDDGFTEEMTRADFDLNTKFLKNTGYVFREKNVVTSIFYGIGLSGEKSNIDDSVVWKSDIFENINIKQIQLAQLQQEKILRFE